MDQKLRSLGLILLLLKTGWDSSQDGMEGDGVLKTLGFNPTEVKLFTMPHPPVGDSGNSYPHCIPRSPFPLATYGDAEVTQQ